MFSREELEQLLKEKTVTEIAEQVNTYPNKIKRLAKSFGLSTMSRSEAQKRSLSVGRATHPTKGKILPEENRRKISVGLKKSWEKLTPEEFERRAQISKDRWANLSESEKQNLFDRAAKAIRKTLDEGSAMERYIYMELTKEGYDVQHHARPLLDDALEVDIWLPSKRVAIEVDGKTHFQPIYGEEHLQKRINADARKNGLLLGAGIRILRLKFLKRRATKYYLCRSVELVKQFLQTNQDYEELEVC